MNNLITIGERGQIVIPKLMRKELNIGKGSKLVISNDKNKIIIKSVDINEDYFWMLLGESSLSRVWDNKYDERWDNVL